MKAHLYVEGRGGSKFDQIACREAFHKLLKNAGFANRLSAVTPCGGRGATFDRFQTAHRISNDSFIAMLIDSEDPIANIEETWKHLKHRDSWDKPAGAVDEQVFLMTTCMETWIVADPETLKSHYGQCLQVSALPSLVGLENRDWHDVQDKLFHATRNCSNTYAKGKRSFGVLAILDAGELMKLPSLARMVRILDQNLA